MDTYLQDKLITIFDHLSKTYSNKFTYNKLEQEKLISLITLWDIKSNQHILEVGGGTGDLTPFLLERIQPKGKLVFLDISPGMITVAQQKLHQYCNVTFVTDGIHSYQNKQTFDKIVIFNTFPHFLDKKTALTNCFRLLKSSGKLIIAHNESRLSLCLHHARKNIATKIADFPDDDVMYRLLREVGFEIDFFENNEGSDYYLVIASK